METLNKDMGPAEVARILRRAQFMTNSDVVQWRGSPLGRTMYLTRYKAIQRETNRVIERFDAFVDMTGAYPTLWAVIIDGETYERGEVYRVVETLMAEAGVVNKDRVGRLTRTGNLRDAVMPSRRYTFPSIDQLSASEMVRNGLMDGVSISWPFLGVDAIVGSKRELLWVSMTPAQNPPTTDPNYGLGPTGKLNGGPLFTTVRQLLTQRGIVSDRTTQKAKDAEPVEGTVKRINVFEDGDLELSIGGQPITAPFDGLDSRPKNYQVGQTYYDSNGNPFGVITSVNYDRNFGEPVLVRLTVMMGNGQVARVDEGPDGGYVTVNTDNTESPFRNVTENMRRMGMSARETSDALGVLGKALSPGSDQFDALRRVMQEIDPNGNIGPAQAMNKAVREKIQRILEDPDPKCEFEGTPATVAGCVDKFCHVHSDTARGRVWISEDKKRTQVKDLKDDHLFNIVRYLEREGRTKGIYPIMLAEFNRRGLGKPRDDGLVRRPNPFFAPPE